MIRLYEIVAPRSGASSAKCFAGFIFDVGIFNIRFIVGPRTCFGTKEERYRAADIVRELLDDIFREMFSALITCRD